MLRKDQHVKFYIIEFYGNTETWKRYNTDLIDDKISPETHEVYADGSTNGFSASGKCWQETGEHATQDLNHAIAIAKALTLKGRADNSKPNGAGQPRKNPTRFRVTRIEMTQRSDVVVTDTDPRLAADYSFEVLSVNFRENPARKVIRQETVTPERVYAETGLTGKEGFTKLLENWNKQGMLGIYEGVVHRYRAMSSALPPALTPKTPDGVDVETLFKDAP